MVKVIMGPKGTGKTKQMIDLINRAKDSEHGHVVAIAHDSKLTYDISSKIRLVDASEYNVNNFDRLRGVICGLYAGNYDITHVFIESLNKLIPVDVADSAAAEEFYDWLESMSEKNGIKFTISVSADASLAPDGVRKYF